MSKDNKKEIKQVEKKKTSVASEQKKDAEMKKIVEENEKLRSEVEELKNMLSQFLNTQNKEEESDSQQDAQKFEEEKIISPNRLINVTSLFYGGMTLRAANKNIRFEKFGITLPVSFEDLTYICNNHRQLAEEGCFLIHSKEAIEALYLSENYKHIENKQTIENLITLSHDQITDIYNNLTDSLKETVQDLVIKGIISGDSKYADRGKIDHISKLCGKNLYKIAQDEVVS